MIAGITGHQDLGAPAVVEWVSASLDLLIETEGVTRGMTSLAEGADQLFARALLARGLPFSAVIPSAGYDLAFHSERARESYNELLAAAVNTIALPFSTPNDQAFFEAGKYIVRHADVLFAVWNGLPAKGLGGTADVVAFAAQQGTPTIHINPVSSLIVRA